MAQEQFWIAAGLLVLLAVLAALGHRRQSRRADPDAVGVMPWQTIQFAALFAAFLAASMALHS